jgi:hypothetical protein
MPFLADVVQAHALGPGTCRRQQPVDRFAICFTPQLKRLVMDREHILRAAILRHFPGLFGITVIADPGLIRADWHDGEVCGPGPLHLPERMGVRGVSAEDDPVSRGFDQVAVVAAVGIGSHPGILVVYFESANLETGHLHLLSPIQLMDGAKPAGSDQVGSLCRGDYRGLRRIKRAEAGPVQVIHMGM